MTIHEYGPEAADAIVLIHPMGERWDIFLAAAGILESSYRVILPALPGYDPEDPDSEFDSVERTAADLEKWMRSHGRGRSACWYGRGMGGAVVMRMLANHRVGADAAVIDGAVTPFLPGTAWLTDLKDRIRSRFGRHDDPGMLKGMIDPAQYTQEELKYMKEVLGSARAGTVRQSLYSARHEAAPEELPPLRTRIQYWYGEKEERERKRDLAYIREKMQTAEIIKKEGTDHTACYSRQPEAFCRDLLSLLGESGESGFEPLSY